MEISEIRSRSHDCSMLCANIASTSDLRNGVLPLKACENASEIGFLTNCYLRSQTFMRRFMVAKTTHKYCGP